MDKSNVLSTRVEDNVFETVEKLAEEQKVNKAKIVYQAIHSYLNGSVKEPVRQNYVQANKHLAEPFYPLPVPESKLKEAFARPAGNISMLQVMTANRRKIKGLTYDKSMEQYFHLIKSPRTKSTSRLIDG